MDQRDLEQLIAAFETVNRLAARAHALGNAVLQDRLEAAAHSIRDSIVEMRRAIAANKGACHAVSPEA